MRKFVAPTLLAMGSFLLVVGILALAWVPGAVKQTPLDVDTVTMLEGSAAKLDPATGDFEHRPIYAVSETRVDSEASTDDVVVWAQTQCAVFGSGDSCVSGDDADLITASISTFATDRVTAEGVAREQLPEGALPQDATDVEGLVNKFPFDTEQRTYPYWESTLGRAVDAVFDRTEDVQGLEAYVFRVEVDREQIQIAEGTPGTYSDVKEIYVEPATGAILDQSDDQQRWLEDGTEVLDLQLAFTDEQISTNVADAESNRARLSLLTRVVPGVGIVVGGLMLTLGALLLVRRSRSRDEDAGTPVEEPVGAGR